jgi:hypothetical protein
MSNAYKHRIFDCVYLTDDGKVGIGTSPDQDTLQVQGTANVRELSAHVITSSNASLQVQMPSARMVIR